MRHYVWAAAVLLVILSVGGFAQLVNATLSGAVSDSTAS
jgi:hypothetical protein